MGKGRGIDLEIMMQRDFIAFISHLRCLPVSGPLAGHGGAYTLNGANQNGASRDNITMPDARKRLVGFCATHLPGSCSINLLAQRGPDEAAERLRAAARRGRIIRG